MTEFLQSGIFCWRLLDSRRLLRNRTHVDSKRLLEKSWVDSLLHEFPKLFFTYSGKSLHRLRGDHQVRNSFRHVLYLLAPGLAHGRLEIGRRPVIPDWLGLAPGIFMGRRTHFKGISIRSPRTERRPVVLGKGLGFWVPCLWPSGGLLYLPVCLRLISSRLIVLHG